MRKLIYFVILLALVLSACEKDDICVEDTTPRLIIKFKSQVDATPLTVNNLTVWPEGKDSIYFGASLDSILIPLNINQSTTLYKFASGDLIDEVTFNYDINEVYVSRSCGIIANFQNVATPEFSTAWITDIQIDNATIENEETAHITIFH